MEVLVDQEVRILAEHGHEVVVIGADLGAGEEPDYGPRVKVIKVAAWNGLERRFEIPWVVFSPRLVTLLWRHVRWCDTVHAHGFLALSSLVALFLARLHGKQSVLTEHIGLAWYASLLKRAIQRLAIVFIGGGCIGLARRSVAYHQRVVALLRGLAGQRGLVSYLPNPLERRFLRSPSEEEKLAARRAFGWPLDRPKVLFVGRLVVRKGIDLLLQAKTPEYDLVFCGPGDASVLGNPPKDGVSYLPSRSRRDLVLLYHAADMLAVPSRSEGGLVLVAQEALLCGLPVLHGQDPGLNRFRGCRGLYFCATKPESVQRGILEILTQGRSSSQAQEQGIPFESFLPSDNEWLKLLLE